MSQPDDVFDPEPEAPEPPADGACCGSGCDNCVLVLVRHEHDPQPIIAQGIWRGQWQTHAAGSNGFGYDPHFYLPEHGCTAAELSPETKNRISHRGLALQALMSQLHHLSS